MTHSSVIRNTSSKATQSMVPSFTVFVVLFDPFRIIQLLSHCIPTMEIQFTLKRYIFCTLFKKIGYFFLLLENTWTKSYTKKILFYHSHFKVHFL